MANVAAFTLQTINNDTTESLWLVFHPNLMEFRNRPGRYIRSTKNLCEEFLIIERNLFDESDEMEIENEVSIPEAVAPDNSVTFDLENDESNDSDELPVKIIDNLYSELRCAHRENGPMEQYSDEYIQHKELRPKLKHYQIDGVKWMLYREQIIDHFPTEYSAVFRRWPIEDDTTKFYYNERTMTLVVNKNDDIQIPSGGVLADAMGNFQFVIECLLNLRYKK